MAKYIFILDGTGAHHIKLMNFLNRYLDSCDIDFWFCGPFCDENKLTDVVNARIIETFFGDLHNLKTLLQEASKVVVVGFFNVQLAFLLLLFPLIRKKTTVALHGGEFYGQRGKTSFKRKCFYRLRRIVLRDIEACCTFTADDYNEAQKFYKLPIKHYLVELPWHFDISFDQMKALKPMNPYVIMVGHSALKEDHTLETLSQLAKYCNNQVEIIAPLSYGEEQYRQEVIVLGKKLFGKKFHPILKWIEPKEYQRLLQSVTVFVIGSDRQAGTFNMNLLLRLGCKVYARKDTSMWSFFAGECKCEMYDIFSISGTEFDDFVSFNYEQKAHNYRMLKNRLNETSCLNSWKKVLGIM